MRRLRYIVIFLFLLWSLLSVDLFADSYWGLMKRGNRYYKNELYGDALRYYSEGDKKNPGVFEPAFNMGDALYKAEDYRGSIKSFDRSLPSARNDFERADIYYNLGNGYFMAGEYDRAIESYIRGLELNPTNLNMKYNLELALKRKKEEQERRETGVDERPSGGDGEPQGESEFRGDPESTESGAKNGKGQQVEKEESQGGIQNESGDERELSREEAERLLSSVNSDQVEIINDIIQQRVHGGETEKDW
jgi:Ca-activated chloride channel family protein